MVVKCIERVKKKVKKKEVKGRCTFNLPANGLLEGIKLMSWL